MAAIDALLSATAAGFVALAAASAIATNGVRRTRTGLSEVTPGRELCLLAARTRGRRDRAPPLRHLGLSCAWLGLRYILSASPYMRDEPGELEPAL